MAAPQSSHSESYSKPVSVQDERVSIVSSPTPNSESTKPKYHPLFDSSYADIVLSSSDDVLYRIHSYTLRHASGFFRTMFSLPQPKCPSVDRNSEDSEEVSEPEPIRTHETSYILTLFLLLLSGKPCPVIPSWGSPTSQAKLQATNSGNLSCCDVIERVLSLAEIWDAPGPISFIRMGITSPTLLATEPVRIYAFACHFGWSEARDVAAQRTLTLDLLREEEPSKDEGKGAGMDVGSAPMTSSIQKSLECLTSRDLLALLNLRKRRIDTFRMLLNSPVRFSAGNTPDYLCARCGVTQLDNESWRLMKNALMFEIDRRPLGDEILGKGVKGLGGTDPLNLGIVTWPEAVPCWEAQCTKEGCGGLNYDRVATLRQIAYCIDALPLHIDHDNGIPSN
ncbi:hypothetical protein VKT23_015708 [Stygiomarasmius scandens]|uniref:BTB domain-containing protein n=1 Tax=Marasmiellus scandens TaxID=2682957 RepID=A0ABR1IX08_9AGAR